MHRMMQPLPVLVQHIRAGFLSSPFSFSVCLAEFPSQPELVAVLCTLSPRSGVCFQYAPLAHSGVGVELGSALSTYCFEQQAAHV
mmetsp:Transcript_79221/g.164424  ORF Transcript_79221/g.164424 Transcript_79221/m.164424 type:complete len:85 (+) Transcript_79221:1142-1396(+)